MPPVALRIGPITTSSSASRWSGSVTRRTMHGRYGACNRGVVDRWGSRLAGEDELLDALVPPDREAVHVHARREQVSGVVLSRPAHVVGTGVDHAVEQRRHLLPLHVVHR